MNWLAQRLATPSWPSARPGEETASPLQVAWRTEVEVMRRENDPDWLAWSPACRARWARAMLAMAEEEGFILAVDSKARAWLEDLAQKDLTHD